MESILLIGSFEGLFLVLLLLTKRKRGISDIILASFFTVFAINIGLTFIEMYNRKNNFPFPSFILTAAPLLLLQAPLLWLYVKSLTTQNFKFKAIYLLHSIPFFTMICHHIFQFYNLPLEYRINLIQSEEFKHFFSYYFFVTIIAISPIIYFYLALRLIKGYTNKLDDFFSHTSEFDLRWLKVILTTWLITYCFINTFFLIDFIIPIASFGIMQFLSFVIGSVFLIFIGFYGIKQENIFVTRNIPVNLEKITKNNRIDTNNKPITEHEKAFVKKILSFMNDEKPFLDPEITLRTLSEKLTVSPEYLSEVLNNDLGKNFFDFINHYRVEEFKSLCKKPENNKLTITGIAFNSGFNTKASFYRAFTKKVGMSPTAYLQQVSQESETTFKEK